MTHFEKMLQTERYDVVVHQGKVDDIYRKVTFQLYNNLGSQICIKIQQPIWGQVKNNVKSELSNL
jgi:hypothetical protein